MFNEYKIIQGYGPYFNKRYELLQKYGYYERVGKQLIKRTGWHLVCHGTEDFCKGALERRVAI